MTETVRSAIAAQLSALGIPADITTDGYPSIVALFEEALATYRGESACSSVGHTLSYADLDGLSAAFAGWLQHGVGLDRGDRVAIQMPNLIQYLVVCLGALRAGMVVVNTNPLYTERELEHQLNDAGVKVMVVQANVAQTAAAVLPRTGVETVVVTEIADLHPQPKRALINFLVKYVKRMVPAFSIPGALKLNDVLRQGAKTPYQAVILNRDDLAMLQYTGGTTGVAKGAMLTHGNLIANVLQSDTFFTTHDISGQGSTILQPLPVYHIYAFTASMYALRVGAHTAFVPNPRDLPSVVKAFDEHRPALFCGLNTLFVALCNDDRFRALDFSNLKVTLSGGMALTHDAAGRWQEVTGCRVSEGYGLTETSPTVSANPGNGVQIGTIGVPVPGTEIQIRNDDGNPLGLDEAGELCVRGPQVMAGYWQRPEATAEVIDADGWFATGDIALVQPDGYLRIVDRKKDMIVVSGFNVYPNELEDVLVAHPDVVECAAIGLRSESTGEAIRMFVVRSNPALTEDAVREFMREGLTGYKVPKSVIFKEELPKTAVGKILRRELRDLD
ncbi:MAG: AMP-binding protein [Luminiphilus sp.]|jgi:long-chain acyl-CoA synthetase|nr:AMP-binding protein [Luminiphilus sp.]